MLCRFLAAAFALWFTVVLGDPGVLHSCPMHGAHGEHGAATAPANHGEHSHGATRHQGEKSPGAECTCVGNCCASPAVAQLTSAAQIVIPDAVAQSTDFPELPRSPAPNAPELLLPFANGPPPVSLVA